MTYHFIEETKQNKRPSVPGRPWVARGCQDFPGAKLMLFHKSEHGAFTMSTIYKHEEMAYDIKETILTVNR